MLELKNVTKQYKTGETVVDALKGVSIKFGKQEFVSILGPSGGGKTTILNIVGGLDRYTTGDLIIDGKSTTDFTDRDWDAYRNNIVGFVFQTYNLIPHQTVLGNVELALTISGVSKAERRRRATEALAEVGLSDQLKKRPNQLSGGQMQRVAIARAIVNNPEVILADEPTGALDTVTSVQIMDILREIAKTRLVIMVTHNPDLAKEYSTRIIHISDGQIDQDSQKIADQVTGPSENQSFSVKNKVKMGFGTSLALSFQNLLTKKGRTLMVAFAGSIGIIGIAAIMALSNGVNNYVHDVEESTLSVYPLTISSTGFDMTSLLVGMTGDDSSDEADASSQSGDENAGQSKAVKERSMVSQMFSRVDSNDLEALKTFIDNPDNGIVPRTNTIQYDYDINPQIFSNISDDSKSDADKVHQVNPDTSFSALGIGSGASSSSIMSMGLSTDMFAELLNNQEVLNEQYDVVAGNWPASSHDLVLVLPSDKRISDMLLYTMGLRDRAELEAMVKAFSNDEEFETPQDRREYDYEELMAVSFKMLFAADYYTFDENYNVWVDHSDDKKFMADLLKNKAEELNISGIVAVKEGVTTTALTASIYYSSDLVKEIADNSEQTEIVKYQLANPALNIFTDKTFVDEAQDSSSNFDMGSMFEIDQDAMTGAFKFDNSVFSSIDFGDVVDPVAAQKNTPPLDLSGIAALGMPISTQSLGNIIGQVFQGFMSWYPSNMSKYANQGAAFTAYMQTPAVAKIMSDGLTADMLPYQDKLTAAIGDAVKTYTTNLMGNISAQISTNMAVKMAELQSKMATAMTIDETVFADAFKFNMDENELQALIMGMMSGAASSLDANLKQMGYVNYDDPASIDIYPIDFESKQEIITILDKYNQDMKDAGTDEKVVTYTDLVGTLMSAVTDIIDMISMVLMAFVAISLIVSSIMIGVITFISVLERKKEIGILRSIGASKRDISNIFNAETLIIGLAAGGLGILLTLLLCVPANIIVYELLNISNIAILPATSALILIAVSMVLSFIAGLLPSSAAAKRDPVEALRSE